MPGSALVVGVGASRGLGAALARRFAAGGLGVAIAGRDAVKLGVVAAEISAAGGVVEAITGDATEAADIARFVAAAEALGPLELAVHNAGGNRRDAFIELAPADFERLWRDHAFGGLLLGQAAARAMLPRGAGTIVFTGASGSLRGAAGFAAFAGAKAATRALAQSMARELGAKGLHIGHVIVDGGIDGDRLRSFLPAMVAEKGPDGLLDPDAIAEAYWQLHRQPRSAWTHELDLRPWSERF